MSSSGNTLHFQASQHELVRTEGFATIGEYSLFLIHLKAYTEAAPMASNQVVLDLGCNNGYGTRIIKDCCKEVIGVDISPRAIAEARRRFGTDGIEFRLVDGVRLPFADGRFDLVVSFQVIEHVGDYEVYLSEMKRVLTPGGKALLTTPNARIRLDPGMTPWNPFHVREFSADELEELLLQYFPKVAVQGLFATDDLYSAELNRVKQAREAARRRPAWLNVLRSQVVTRTPYRLLNQIVTVRRGLNNLINARKLDPVRLQRLSVADLFYRQGDVDQALDLMAICEKETSLHG